MKIALLGATGRTGKWVLIEAIERGIQVNALVRNPAGLNDVHSEKLQVSKVDIFNEDDLCEHFKGSDAVISCLGGKASICGWTASTLYTDSLRSITAAMRKADVKRVILMSAWGSVPTPGEPFIIKYLLRPILIGNLLRNMSEMEIALAKDHSDLDYTVVRPPGLAAKPSSGKVIRAENGRQFLSDAEGMIPQIDVAKYLLECVNNRSVFKTCVAIGLPR